MLPAAKAIPKEMVPVVDKPAIQYVVEEAVQSGATDVLVITGRGKGAREDHFVVYAAAAGLRTRACCELR